MSGRLIKRTLRGQVLTCAVRLTPAGVRLEQSIGTRRLVAQTFQTADALCR